ncbi:MAG: hypothetical protein JSR54_10740 [Proteobacteria bacterium]|nr:hypothetical protein [Pseudomonadota bacterium]
MRTSLAVLLALVLAVAGCAREPPPPAPAAKPAPTVFDPLVQSEDRARAVERTVQEQDAAARRQIAAAEGAAPEAQR